MNQETTRRRAPRFHRKVAAHHEIWDEQERAFRVVSHAGDDDKRRAPPVGCEYGSSLLAQMWLYTAASSAPCFFPKLGCGCHKCDNHHFVKQKLSAISGADPVSRVYCVAEDPF